MRFVRSTRWKRLARSAIATSEFVLRPTTIQALNALAVDGLTDAPGGFRCVDSDHPILGSRHRPPPSRDVPAHVASMCNYINDHPPLPFHADSPRESVLGALDRGVHVSAYALWRLNWIHPFEDGNGRTSRALCHLLLCVHARMVLPGTKSMPERIAAEKRKYYNCLDSADEAHRRKRRVRLQQMEGFVSRHFFAQLRDYLATQKR